MSDVAKVLLAVLLAYLIGALPSAYLAVWWRRRVDIRLEGSRNAGALNTYRVAGLGWALPVLVADAAKGIFAVGIVKLLAAPEEALYLASVAALAGHNWPVFLGFRGGRGAATVFGISLSLLPVLTVVSLGSAAAIGLSLRRPAAGIFAGFIVLNGLTIATRQPGAMIGLCLALTFMVGVTYCVRQRQRILRALQKGRWLEILGIE